MNNAEERGPLKREQSEEAIEVANPVKFLSTVTFSEIPEVPILSAQAGQTTISVLNTERVRLNNTGAVTVTNLTNGQEGQLVAFLGDGFTTFANNTNIRTNTATNKLLAANQVYIFIRINSLWVETAASGSSFLAGTGLSLTGATFANLYVGRTLTLLAEQISFTAVSGLQTFPGTNVYAARINSTNMTNVRVSCVGTMTGGNAMQLYIQYSTDGGSSWTSLTLGGAAGLFNGTGMQYVTSSVALPVGARNAATWFRPAYLIDLGSPTATFSGFHLEFTP